MMTKDRPAVHGFMHKPLAVDDNIDNVLYDHIDATENNTDEHSNELVPIPIKSVSCLAGNSMEIDDAFNILRSQNKKDNIELEAAKLDVMYDDWLEHMINKTCKDK